MPGAHFGFTKLLVNDLEGCAAFYSGVCGLRELARVDAEIAGRPIREIMYHPTADGGATFVLLQFLDRPGTGSEAILGFQTDDLQDFVRRAVAAGGQVADPTTELPEHGVKVAFVRDVEGHLLEVVELLRG
jgi:predicted enzyme related to lactoylglutathione lyase